MAAGEAEGRRVDVAAAALGKCPRCGRGKLYKSFVEFRERCEVCGLSFADFNVGDGAVVFLILILNTIGLVGAVTLELSAHPPYWVHVAIWPALLIYLTVVGLRAGKGLLLAFEYRHDAREGALGADGDDQARDDQ